MHRCPSTARNEHKYDTSNTAAIGMKWTIIIIIIIRIKLKLLLTAEFEVPRTLLIPGEYAASNLTLPWGWKKHVIQVG